MIDQVECLTKRIFRIYDMTGSPPKRVSISRNKFPLLKQQASPPTADMSFGKRGRPRFHNIPLRVRDYAREHANRQPTGGQYPPFAIGGTDS